MGGAVGGGTPRLGLPVIPSLREAAWSCCGGSRRDQSTARPRLMGVMTFVERAPGLVRAASRGGLSVEAADVSVTQAVVDEGEQIAGGGDLADALAAAIGDPLAVDAQLGIHGQLLDRREGGTDAGERLDGSVAGVAVKLLGDQPGEERHFVVVGDDEVQQRGDSQPVGACQGHWLSSSMPALPNRSLIGAATPSLASTACTCALRPERRATSFARWRTRS